MNKQEFMKYLNPKIIIPICGGCIFLVSLMLYIFFPVGERKIFIYESIDGDNLYLEARYIPQETVQGDIAFFVDELLLGPIADRYRSLFVRGTKALFCFMGEDKTLYINLSEEAVLQKENSSETLNACKLLEKNILKNYDTVDSVVIFMMGNSLYEYSVENLLNS